VDIVDLSNRYWFASLSSLLTTHKVHRDSYLTFDFFSSVTFISLIPMVSDVLNFNHELRIWFRVVNFSNSYTSPSSLRLRPFWDLKFFQFLDDYWFEGHFILLISKNKVWYLKLNSCTDFSKCHPKSEKLNIQN